MWGTQKPQGAYPSKRRFISTCCGKNDYFRAVATVLRTPSPRVWRAQGKTQRELAEHRLIPTCVGSTPSSCRVAFSRSAHPHVCGEHSPFFPEATRAEGSSPRVWGAPSAVRLQERNQRLIPTCVGSTTFCITAGLEHSGSSPRVWGAPTLHGGTRSESRLIPTCVGSTG